jgi:hypothetical protein
MVRESRILKNQHLRIVAVYLLTILIISGVLYVLYITVCGGISNCIAPPFVLSPDGEKLAMIYGPLSRRGTYPSVETTALQACVLDLREDFPQLVPIDAGPRPVLAMDWRPGTSPPELFMAPKQLGGPQYIFAVKVPNGVLTTSSWILSRDLMVIGMAWNPSGQILAVPVIVTTKNDGIYLAVSYDNGKSFAVTDIAISSSKLVWTDDETLYVQNKNDILELNVGDRNPRVSKIFVSAEGLHLSCGLEGKVVYYLGGEIYWGNQLLHKSNRKISQVITDGSHLAFKADNYVGILDKRGNVKNERNVGQGTMLVALSSAHKFVYLMRNGQSIERYSFVDNDEIYTVYRVNH